MFPSYAIPSDLAAAPWSLALEEAEATRLLSYANRLMRKTTQTALYEADSEGLPVDDALKKAYKDAACSQVATWVALSSNPATGAANAGTTIAAKTRGSASVQYVNYASTVLARARAATRVSEDALAILQEAGLVGTAPIGY